MSIGQQQLSMWGGVECTINRVRNKCFDQLAWSGHRNSVERDLDLFAGIGLNTLRTAVHWEHFDQTGCWSHPDRTLQHMRRLGQNPIVGLLHHGSGPAHTSLLDPEFPSQLAAFALQVAERYPWVEQYTPVNEPQTTGRFACLYGHWFPHHRNMRSYVRALHNQIKGVSLSMHAIRSVQPNARLIHTEDAGQTFSAPSLNHFRIEREHRRWLGLDLLCGCVTERHPLFAFLLHHGLSHAEIMWFAEHPCPPSIIGLNYYVTSDRYLDDRLYLYPEFMSGGDTGYEPLVDVEAVRVRPEGIAGVKSVLMQAWQRYHLPLAITEAHLGCHPQEQVRWLAEVFREATAARADGADVRAVTAWALLGLYNWSNLCTVDAGSYEPGVFDLSGGSPRPTPLTELVRQLAAGEQPLRTPKSAGWWRKDSRLNIYPPLSQPFEGLQTPSGHLH